MSFIKYLILTNFLSNVLSAYVLVLNPAGHINYTGRSIQDSFERGLTYQLAQALQKKITEINPSIIVHIARNNNLDEQNYFTAQFCNKVHADLCIAFSFFQQDTTPQNLYIFYNQHDINDELHMYNPLYLYPVDQAHLQHFKINKNNAEKFYKTMNISSSKTIATQQPIAMPCTALQGISIPALYVELGLCKIDDFKKNIDSIAEAIVSLCM